MTRLRLGIGMVVLCLLGGYGRAGNAAAGTAVPALAALEPFHLVKLDTAAIAAAVRAGAPVRLPFVTQNDTLTTVQVRLALRNLRSRSLTVADLKNGVGKTFRTITLPPPATYQGRVVDKEGVAVLTVNPQVVEGNILIAPDGNGWSIIEPLEPQLRLHGVDAARRAALLRDYNHIVYNVRTQHQHVKVDADLYHGAAAAAHRKAAAPTQLVVSTVGDGDDAFVRAYPLDSVMPFWLKEETLFNSLDWLFNCIEPAANSANSFALCDNPFDGGADGFRASVQLDRLEGWEAGGPNSADRDELLRQSARETHQAAPPCCGPPHTAGRSALVFFFSGRTLQPGAGVASVAGLDVYGDSCFSDREYLCHHALTQVTPSAGFPGNAFFQELLVAHEVGHILGGAEQPLPFGVCWLHGKQCGPNLMGSIAFSGDAIYLFTADDTHFVMGPLLQERLGGGHPGAAPAAKPPAKPDRPLP
jgi:hypothetical protein